MFKKNVFILTMEHFLGRIEKWGAVHLLTINQHQYLVWLGCKKVSRQKLSCNLIIRIFRRCNTFGLIFEREFRKKITCIFKVSRTDEERFMQNRRSRGTRINKM